MASNFSDEPAGSDGATPASPPNDPAVTPDGSALSAAVMKFRSCRWRRPPDEGGECCTHRDVMPIAGTGAFNADAWCPDCAYFKLRRAPRKRAEPEENSYW